jgi:SAM-dependent methyltransferase
MSIREAVRKKYMAVSGSAEGLFRYATGKAGAEQLGYDESILAGIPAELLNAFCGVGNPFAIRAIAPGSDLLDIGCGAGFDLIVAHRTVGRHGRVCGIDMTAEMVQRARNNFAALDITGIETLQVDSETIPYADATFDVAISNGVINLSPRKLELFREILRVLKPGGRLQFVDIVLEKELPPSMTGDLDAWAQ